MTNPQFTITLGRTGQVVKRGRTSTEHAQSQSDIEQLPGNKRSLVRSEYDDDNEFFSRKRQRGHVMSFHGRSGFKDKSYGVARNDLRLKLMHKSRSKKIQGVVEDRKRIDLRQTLSRNNQPSEIPSMLQRRPEAKESSLVRQFRRRESADDLYLVHSSSKPVSSYVDGRRARSPDAYLKTSTRLSSPRYFDPLRRGTAVRATDGAREEWFSRNDGFDTRYSTGSRPLKMTAFPETGKLVPQLRELSGSVAKRPLPGQESLNVSSLLHSLGLGKYAIHFQAEEIDMAALKQMGDKDLKELGIPMGPRKKILLALLPRFKRQPS